APGRATQAGLVQPVEPHATRPGVSSGACPGTSWSSSGTRTRDPGRRLVQPVEPNATRPGASSTSLSRDKFAPSGIRMTDPSRRLVQPVEPNGTPPQGEFNQLVPGQVPS